MKRAIPLAALLLFTAPAVAHPIPNLRYDRATVVTLAPGGARVSLTLELSEWSLVLDGAATLGPAAPVEPQAGSYAKSYAARKGKLLADELLLTTSGKRLPLRFESATVEPDADHFKLAFRYAADWPPEWIGGPVRIRDDSFDDRPGTARVTLEAVGGVGVSEMRDARQLPALLLDYKPEDYVRSRVAEAAVTLPVVATPVAEETPAIAPEPPTLWDQLSDRGPVALLDSPRSLPVLLALCVLFGAGHAFTPGHGKALVAAYLVGERGTVAHAVALGITTTVAHTGAVILVAAAARLAWPGAAPEYAAGWLGLAGGIVVTALGVWLFTRRIAGRADHVHLHAPTGVTPTGRVWRRVVLLGLAGGAVPCADAVLLLVVALNQGRGALALPMLLAFSAGLALVLTALGVGVVLAGAAARGRSSLGWTRWLPVVSAALLVALGLGMVRDAGQRLFGG